MLTRSSSRFLLAQYARLEVAAAIHKTFALDFSAVFEQLNVSIWSQDRIRQTCVLVSASPSNGPHADRGLWEHDDGVGHIDLVWRARAPLVLPRLTMSTRAVVMQADDPAVCVLPLRIQSKDSVAQAAIPTVCYVETSGSLQELFQGHHAVRLAESLRSALMPMIAEADLLDHPVIRPIEKPDRQDVRARIDRLFRLLMGKADERAFSGIAGVDGIYADGPALPRSSVFINADWLTSRRSRLIQRGGIFAASTSRVDGSLPLPERVGDGPRAPVREWLDPSPINTRANGDMDRYFASVARYRISFELKSRCAVGFEFHVTADASPEFKLAFDEKISEVGLDEVAEIVGRIHVPWGGRDALYHRELAQGVLRHFLDLANGERGRASRGKIRLEATVQGLSSPPGFDARARLQHKANQLRIKLTDAGNNLVLVSAWYTVRDYCVDAEPVTRSDSRDAIWRCDGHGPWNRVDLRTTPSEPGIAQFSQRRNATALERLVATIVARPGGHEPYVAAIQPEPTTESPFVGIRAGDLIHFLGAKSTADGRQMPYSAFGCVRHGDDVWVVFAQATLDALRSWLQTVAESRSGDVLRVSHPEFGALAARWHRLPMYTMQQVVAVPWARERVRNQQAYLEARASDTVLHLGGAVVPDAGLAVLLGPIVSDGRLTPGAVEAFSAAQSQRELTAAEIRCLSQFARLTLLDLKFAIDKGAVDPAALASLTRLICRVVTGGAQGPLHEVPVTSAATHSHGVYFRPLSHNAHDVPRVLAVWIVEDSRRGQCRTIHPYDGRLRQWVDTLCSSYFPAGGADRDHVSPQAKRELPVRIPLGAEDDELSEVLLELESTAVRWCGWVVDLKPGTDADTFLRALAAGVLSNTPASCKYQREPGAVRRALKKAQKSARWGDERLVAALKIGSSPGQISYSDILKSVGNSEYRLALKPCHVSVRS